MNWVRDIDSFYNFIGYVVLCAPDQFPVEDYLPPDGQMNLERAFVELSKGVEMATVDSPVDDVRRTNLQGLLAQSLAAYKNGEDVKGAHLLQEMERMVFKR